MRKKKEIKVRKVGDVLLDMEPLLFELVEHELQRGDILALVYQWINTHAPGTIEEYLDGTNPEMYYGKKK